MWSRYLRQLATHFEELSLWQQWHGKIDWVQLNPGTIVTVGKIDGKPVAVEFHWCRLDGASVLFYNPSSMVVDWEKVRFWLRKNCCPRDKDGRRNHCDAMNFHQCIWWLRDRSVLEKVAAASV